MNDEEYEVLSRYLGDLLDDVIERYNYDVDVDEEYDELLNYIYKALIKAWFKGKRPAISSLEHRLRDIRRRERKKLMILLSFYISRYLRRKRVLTLR
mgnify:CR=1 FL=1